MAPSSSDSDSDYYRSSRKIKQRRRTTKSRNYESSGKSKKSRSSRRSPSSDSSDSRSDRRRRKRSQGRKVKPSRSKSARSPSRSNTSDKIMNEKIPGFSEMTLAEKTKARIKAVIDASGGNSGVKQPAQTLKTENFISNAATHVEHAERSLILENLNEDEFMPSHFKSSRKAKQKESQKPKTAWKTVVQSFAVQEGNHELAIFGNLDPQNIDTKPKSNDSKNYGYLKKSIDWKDRDPKTLMNKRFDLTQHECDERWKKYLCKKIAAK